MNSPGSRTLKDSAIENGVYWYWYLNFFNFVFKLFAPAFFQDTTLENGVYWYRHFNAFGFADTGEVWLNDCDVAYPKSAKRVSWFVDQNIGPTYTLNPSLNPKP
jgi:hypothetical protein